MLRMHARAAAIAAVCSGVGAVLTPAAAQHDHHAVLDTVRVRAERDVVQLRSGATVVDARASRAAGGSIANLLRTVPNVDVRLNDPSRSDRLEFRIADATFTQERRRRTARPLVSLFASWAVGAAPREDAPVRTEGPTRIF